jgi:hypothetical protein
VALGLVDGGLVLTFGALVAADGLARVPARGVVFGRTSFGAWRAAQPATRAGLRLTAPLAPFTSGIVVPWAPATIVSAAEFTHRLSRTDGARRMLALLGATQLLGFVVGLPAAVAYWSGAGLIAALVVNLVISMAIAAVARGAMRSLGPSVGDGSGARLLRALSPFSAAAASNDVLRAAAMHVPAVAAARVLLPAATFARWVRPFAWDHVRVSADPVLSACVGEDEIARWIASAPERIDATALGYCPRCAAEFATVAAECPACEVAVSAFDEVSR